MDAKKVFISYSHDSDAHRDRVLGLSERLRDDGIETILDQYVNGSPSQGWPRWMLDQLDEADYVLVVCTETYYQRFRGHEEPGKGKGVDWEGALITQEIYDSRSRTLKFVPVFLTAAVNEWIPDPLRSISYYTLTSEREYKCLYDFLLDQTGVEPRPVGTPKLKPRRKGDMLTFEDSHSFEVTKADISRIDRYAPEELIGREAELALLDEAWEKVTNHEPNRPHVITFVALGGEGKTSLVARWTAGMAHKDWPGCEAAFAWSFYSQGTREQGGASSDTFFKEALIFFGDPAMAESAAGSFDKGKRLARLVGERRALLILDGLEPLQYPLSSPMAGELKDQGVSALLKGLAASSNGFCIVTTRFSLPDLRAYRHTTAPEEELLRLSTEAGVSLLKRLGVTTGSRDDFEKLVEDVGGHALTLQIMGEFLKRACRGDVRCRDRVRFEKADAKIQGGHAFRAMAAYEKWLKEGSEESRRELALLYLMGLFDRPATGDCLGALLAPPAIPGLTEPLVEIGEEDLNLSLDALEGGRLLTVNRSPASLSLPASIDAHPLLREYFAKNLRENHTEAWRAGHKRLYEHLCANTHEGDQPTLEELQPLYQAVAHGCQAGLQQEACEKVYHGRIGRRQEFYSTSKLGAVGSDLGAVACFFEAPWSRVSQTLPEVVQSWLLNQAAFRLRALGRLAEALEPMRAGLEMRIKLEDWGDAARSAGNLSELELSLGDIAGSIADAEESVTYADRRGDPFQRMANRTTYADALHQAARREEALALFREAEGMQTERQPEYPLLYSLQGFRYCNLLLADVVLAAWKSEREAGKEDLLAVCDAVTDRGEKMFGWRVPSDSLLDIALDHLTLGRTALYLAILEGGDFGNKHPDLDHIDRAVDGLRRAGYVEFLIRGLLTRAWQRSLIGPITGPESAKSDLDEAWEIAERGPMPLFMADIHLHRARLFHREADYPWESPRADLAKARRLIEKHGYWRRKEELEDAEAAILR